MYQGKKAGALGDISCFSFYPTKGLGAFGDGGMVVTNRKDIYETVLMLRDYGRKGRYDHKIKGYNSRLDTIQAVVLAAKLRHLDKWNKMRMDNAAYYCELLEGVEGVVTPKTMKDRTHVFQTFAVRLADRDKVCVCRDCRQAPSCACLLGARSNKRSPLPQVGVIRSCSRSPGTARKTPSCHRLPANRSCNRRILVP